MTMDAAEGPARGPARASVAAVWGVVLLGSVLVGVLVEPDARLQWLPIVLGVSTILAFCLQLALDSKVGFVNRLMASVGGAVVLLAAATGAFALLGTLGG